MMDIRVPGGGRLGIAGSLRRRRWLRRGRGRRRDDGAFLRFATSTAHADAPLDADRVRLEVRGSGYLIEPRGASCKVTHVSCVAPGDAPAFLVNRLAWQRTAMVLKVRALVLADSS